jgi:hypothetical protein
MSLLDIEQIEQNSLYKHLAHIYIKIRKYKYGTFTNPNTKWVYGGVIGDVDDDMVLTSQLSRDSNSNYILNHKWISKHHPEFCNKYCLYYTNEYSQDVMITPDLIQQVLMDKYKYIL